MRVYQAHPFSLLEKSLHFMRWAALNCKKMLYAIKTNEHSFVRLDLIADKLLQQQSLPRTAMVWGRMMKSQPAKLTDQENHHGLSRWPDYPSGSGFVCSKDVASFLGKTNVKALPAYEFEDRGVGLILEGKAHLEVTPKFVNLNLLNGREEFRPV